MNRASGSTCSRSPSRQKKRHSSSKSSGAPSSPSRTCGRPPSGRKLVNAPSAFSTASRSILPRSAARMIGTRSSGARSSLKPPSARPPSSTSRRKSIVSETRRQRPLELHPVPALDDAVRRRADPEREAAAAGVGQRRRLLGEQRRAAGEHADDAGAEPGVLGPARRERQRREAVGALGLARPDVGVAGGLGAAHVLLAVAQRQQRQRQGQAPASLAHLGAPAALTAARP